MTSNRGETDHCGKDCPSDMQDSNWADGGTWENREGQKMGHGEKQLEQVEEAKGRDWHGHGK